MKPGPQPALGGKREILRAKGALPSFVRASRMTGAWGRAYGDGCGESALGFAGGDDAVIQDDVAIVEMRETGGGEILLNFSD